MSCLKTLGIACAMSEMHSTPGWDSALVDTFAGEETADHFLAVASRAHTLKELSRVLTKPRSTVIDIGCLEGVMIGDMMKAFPDNDYIGSEYLDSVLPRLRARYPDASFIQMDCSRCQLEDGSVDAIVSLNVLEHVEEDRAALAHFFRILRPGGSAIIELPAGPHLFDSYDRALLHFRRYAMSELTAYLKSLGFLIETESHLGFSIYPAFWMTKRLNQIRYKDLSPADCHALLVRQNKQSVLSKLLTKPIMATERMMRDLVYLPFGIRCLVTCRKPS